VNNETGVENRVLLRRAYPEGYLAMRGVRTVGGWTLIEIMDDGHPVFTHPQKNSAGQWTAMEAGDLLPLVHPDETATWACLLRDLADEAFPLQRGWPIVTLIPGQPVLIGLASANGTPLKHSRTFALDLPTKDPALALVRVRAMLREAPT
jgi:hypothetical protein